MDWNRAVAKEKAASSDCSSSTLIRGDVGIFEMLREEVGESTEEREEVGVMVERRGEGREKEFRDLFLSSH